MRRVLLIIIAFLCCGWGLITVGGGAPSRYITLFTESCTGTDGVALSGWTNLGTGQWEYQSNTCTNDMDVTQIYGAAYSSSELTTSSQFCSALVTQISSGASNIGCAFNVQGSESHYFVGFANLTPDFVVRSHDSTHGIAGGAKNGSADCGCNTTSPNEAYSVLTANDYIGITMTGTGSGTDLTFTFYDFGTSAPTDLQDPSTFAAGAERICTCDYSELNAATAITYLDTPGFCGMEAWGNANDTTDEPNIDDIACGEIP